jgi:hypothetical protein
MDFAQSGIIGLGLLVLAGVAAPVGATPINLITNGDFEQTTISTASPTFGSYQMNTANVTGWSTGTAGSWTGGYNFLFAASSTGTSGTTADTTGAYTPEYKQYLELWGPGNGAINGLSTSPTGGNFVGADGAFQVGAITQVVGGLTAGQTYALTFNWAGAQQQGYTGVNSEGWIVNFGGDSFDTGFIGNTDKGFTGWRSTTVIFTAHAGSQVLSFLAEGLPSGVPPFTLLDSVTMFAVPEPTSWGLMLVAVTGCAALAWRRRRAAAAQARNAMAG